MENFQFTLLEEVQAEIAALTSALRHMSEEYGAEFYSELLVYPEAQTHFNNLSAVEDRLLDRCILEWEKYGLPF